MRHGASKNMSSPLRISSISAAALRPSTFVLGARPQPAPSARAFTTSSIKASWLQPKRKLSFKDPKGRPRVATGGSVRGTTVIWGDYGLRLKDHDRRISAAQLKNGEDVIRRRLRGLNFRLFSRFGANVAVYTKGNESRMGTGKGSFDYWGARVSVSRIIFELKGDVHEQIIRDAMRLAAAKMPGLSFSREAQDKLLMPHRTVRVCKERGSPNDGSYQTRRRYHTCRIDASAPKTFRRTNSTSLTRASNHFYLGHTDIVCCEPSCIEELLSSAD